MTTAEDSDRFWPLWGPHAGFVVDGRVIPPFAALARYISREAVDGLPQLKVARAEGGDPVQEAALAGALFDALAEGRVRYALDPRTPAMDEMQQIRHPAWLLDERVGTCLDLAATFGSMCVDHHLRPLLAIGARHALIVLAFDAEPGRPVELPGCTSETPGVLVVDDAHALARHLEHDAVAAVECIRAAIRRNHHGAEIVPSDYGDARRAGADALRRMVAHDRVRLVDAAWLHEPYAHQVVPLRAPARALAVHLFLPGGARPVALFGAQSALAHDLRDAAGVHVVLAPPGQGKSTIARRLVAEAPFGAGWFLDASSPAVLDASLAAAELAQVAARTGAGLTEDDRAGHAEAARTRLRRASHRWIVALDNADGEPGPILAGMPRPRPGQLVVITTTNAEWEHRRDVQVHRLEPLTADEVTRQLGDPTFVPLVAGRALLVDGFTRLARALDVGPADLPVQLKADEADGPMAYWRLAAERALDDDAVHIARLAAYLPPNHVDTAALATLDMPGAAIARLEAVGVLDGAGGDGIARLHRLYGEAIRRHLAATEAPARRDAVVAQATSAAPTARVLGEFADAALLELLFEALEDRHRRALGPDRDLGASFAAVGELLELRNRVQRSADAYRLALEHLDEEVLEDRPLVATCLHGMVRPIYQHNDTEEALRPALRDEERAHALMEAAGLGHKAGKFEALRGNLEVKLSQYAADEVAALEAAYRRLEHARDMRLQDPEATPEERARAVYNLAGPSVRLARAKRAEAARHLDDAEVVYRDVLARRQQLYQADVHGHVAACIAGLGVVDFLRAVLVASDEIERTELLRQATRHAQESARHREELAGRVDDDDVGKSYRLLAKVSVARFLATRNPQRRFPQWDVLLTELVRELRDGDLLPPQET